MYFLAPKFARYVAKASDPNWIYIIAFNERLDLVATNIARSEGLSSQADIKSRAVEIMKDAIKLTPETSEGKSARAESQKYAGQIAHMNTERLFRDVDSDMVLQITKEAQQFARNTKTNVLAMKTVNDFDHVPFSNAYLKTWIDTADFIASGTARKENLAGQELTNRATEIFKDAVRVEPKTREGEIVRTAAQSWAKITTDS